MNICFVYDGNHIVTPPLTGSILPGVTRKSVIALARDLGHEVSEQMVHVGEMLADIESGRITEVFGCGTAAVIAPVGKFGYQDKEYVINDYEVGPITQRLYQELTDIQYGRIEDRFDTDRRGREMFVDTVRPPFPVLSGVEVPFHWGGPLGVPRDWHPPAVFDPCLRACPACQR